MEQLEGVFLSAKKDGTEIFRSSVTYHRKHISLGSYTTGLDAHRAYLEALRLLNEFPIPQISDYNSLSPLPFLKWVVLINFRVNQVYFSTPLFVRPLFFYYYYSPELVLKFDIDDLFYFSSRKIMKRGGHYFVADFGMQVNILNRFGIKNYAVPGRDYQFLNGDTTDFRRENLSIKNQYHGVLILEKKNPVQYCARIHINGNYVIGVYASMTEAAIAYNKAIDILQKNGCKKNFTANYLEDVSAAAYADIYTALTISPKLYQLLF